MKYDLIVIGAGINGLAASLFAAKNKMRVLMVDRRREMGGTQGIREFHPGFKAPGLHFGGAPISEEIVHKLELARFGLKIHRETSPVLFFESKDRFIPLSQDSSQMLPELTRYSKKDADQYQKFQKQLDSFQPFVKKVFSHLPPEMLPKNFLDFLELMKLGISLRSLGKKDMLELTRVLPMCVADWLNEWFETDFFKAGLSMSAFSGVAAGPWSPGTNTNFILSHSLSGISVSGGVASLLSSMEAAARSYGVNYLPESEVRKILTSQKKVKGIELASGKQLEANWVAATCDPRVAFRLLPREDRSFSLDQKLGYFRSEGTHAVVHLAVDGDLPACFKQANCVRMASHLDEIERSFDASKYGEFSQNPVLEMTVPTKDSPELVPPGKHILSLFVPYIPYSLKGGWDKEKRETLLKQAISKAQEAWPHLPDQIEGHELLTPPEIEREYGCSRGQIFHGDLSLDQLLIRPCPELGKYVGDVEGLYYCGTGSHPGIQGRSGFYAARNILEKFQRRS